MQYTLPHSTAYLGHHFPLSSDRWIEKIAFGQPHGWGEAAVHHSQMQKPWRVQDLQDAMHLE